MKALADSTSGVRRIAAAASRASMATGVRRKKRRGAVAELKNSLQEQDSDMRYTVNGLLTSLGVHTPETDVLQPNETPTSTPEKRRKLAASLFLASLLRR